MATLTSDVESYPYFVAVNRKLAVPTVWPFCAISKLPDWAAAACGKAANIKARNPVSGRKT